MSVDYTDKVQRRPCRDHGENRKEKADVVQKNGSFETGENRVEGKEERCHAESEKERRIERGERFAEQRMTRLFFFFPQEASAHIASKRNDGGGNKCGQQRFEQSVALCGEPAVDVFFLLKEKMFQLIGRKIRRIDSFRNFCVQPFRALPFNVFLCIFRECAWRGERHQEYEDDAMHENSPRISCCCNQYNSCKGNCKCFFLVFPVFLNFFLDFFLLLMYICYSMFFEMRLNRVN